MRLMGGSDAAMPLRPQNVGSPLALARAAVGIYCRRWAGVNRYKRQLGMSEARRDGELILEDGRLG